MTYHTNYTVIVGTLVIGCKTQERASQLAGQFRRKGKMATVRCETTGKTIEA